MRKIKMIGREFGRLTVKEKAGKKGKRIAYKCKCICGQEVVVTGEHLRSGHTKSCGCLQGQKHGMSGTRVYNSWCHMIDRCNNPQNDFYFCYGGKGISVCIRWLKFENFYKDMGDRPTGLTIDRVDNNLGYYKKNCRWATPLMQTLNRGLNKNNKTGIKGVAWENTHQKYIARIMVNYNNIFLGYFGDIKEAKNARIIAEQKYWGKFK